MQGNKPIIISGPIIRVSYLSWAYPKATKNHLISKDYEGLFIHFVVLCTCPKVVLVKGTANPNLVAGLKNLATEPSFCYLKTFQETYKGASQIIDWYLNKNKIVDAV